MARNSLKSNTFKPAGYAFLVQKFDLRVMPHWHISEIGGSVHQAIVESHDYVREVFPKDYWPGDVQLNHTR